MDGKDRINLQGVPETMFQTLYARAKESRKPKAYIYGEKAIKIVSELDYDFSLADKDITMSSGVIARTILLERMTEEWLEENPGAMVVNIACGLDTRCYRMDGKFVRWYNLDLPETIAIRKRFLQESGPISMIACSAMDAGWANEIAQTN